MAVVLMSSTMLLPGFVDDGYGDYLKLRKYYGAKFTYTIYLAVQCGFNEFGIPKEEIAALMKSESDFNPRAVSCVGARGLCQVMPYNGPANTEDLFDPFVNVHYGMKYYKYCLTIAKGNRTEALRFYNAGPASIRANYKNWSYVNAIKSNTVYARNVNVKEFFEVR